MYVINTCYTIHRRVRTSDSILQKLKKKTYITFIEHHYHWNSNITVVEKTTPISYFMRFLSSWLRLRSELLKLSDLLLVLLLLAMFTRKLLWTIGPVMMIIVYKIGVGMSPNWGLLNGSSIHWFSSEFNDFFAAPKLELQSYESTDMHLLWS